MKQMTLIEMDGFLKGKCIPRDLKVNETNTEYLVRKFAELEAKCAALAAENAGLKDYLAPIGLKVEGTPTTDAVLAEIERKAIRKFINSIEHILRDKLSPYDTEEMLEAMRIFLEEQGGEQKWQ
ncbi:TPA: hypothetical protein ACM67I_004398 [Escherichia coli]|jgi:hypothetical protein|uniref:hypothetical protein n=1 Tax=Escherichia coli TaxID=562 RepID=UPI0002323E23|nr:hypothetical protein [Escherichia coli]YP_007004306.1 hypothetical protein F415_gp07 [Enterobacteria phage IME10]AER08035.1 hypothetical protein [Enterobacteria phage IME10]EEV3402440.1 hypothetical protein [Escherichia coli]EEY8547913.1 hypothetical protein [Escherichia coli]EEY9725910.1 hypothetical protein [Escherichia coli]EFC0752739.1 hypothetical protein [Escherichia coli]